MESRKGYVIKITKTELKGLIWGLDAYRDLYKDSPETFESLRLELEELLKSK